jgi:hypothetical protein
VSPAAVRAWLVSRAAVVLLVAVAVWLQARHGYGRAPVRPDATGFFVWDGGWYRDIAAHGYGGVAREGLRFFPLVPLLAMPFGRFAGAALLVVVGGSALAYAEGLVRIARAEWGDERVAGRAAWLALLNPVAFVLVLAYAEATAAALAVWTFWALRRRSWWLAAVLAFGAGLARPVGLLLALPVLVEALRGWRTARDLPARALAVCAAPLGCLAWLVWCGVAYGDALAPFRVQQASDLRGGVLGSPWTALARAWRAATGGGRVVVALHLVWVPLVLWLLWLAWRRLPASYAAYSTAVVLLAVGTPRLASFERYALSAFPLLLVAARTRSRVGLVTLGVACGLGLAGYTILAIASLYVP